jgi:hypothetical protein
MTKEKLLARKEDLLKGSDMLKKRIEGLQNELKKTVGALNANTVAAQEIDYWLKDMESEKKKAKK